MGAESLRCARLDDLVAKVHEHLRDVDLDRADLVAGAAQTRGVRERARVLQATAAAASGSRRSDRDRWSRRRGRRSARTPGRRSGMPSSGCSSASGGRSRRRARWCGRCRRAPDETPADRRRASRPSRARCRGSSARPSMSAGAAAGRPRSPAMWGSTFSIPITVISTSGKVVHIRALPSDSTTATVPVCATAKLAPLIPTRAARNSRRR